MPAGLEYDLDIFNIVAVSDFNMGAMEVQPYSRVDMCYATPTSGF